MIDDTDNLPTDDDLDAAMDELSPEMILNGMGMVHAFYLQSGGGPMGMRDLVAALWCAMRATQILEWRSVAENRDRRFLQLFEQSDRAKPARRKGNKGSVH